MLRQAAHRLQPLQCLAQQLHLTASAQAGQRWQGAAGYAAAAAGGPTTATPPPDASRGATADLADVFVPESVDVVAERSVHIMEPIFRCASRCCGREGAAAACWEVHGRSMQPAQQKTRLAAPACRDFGGNLRFSGQAATVKCFENNPLVRKALEEKGNGRCVGAAVPLHTCQRRWLGVTLLQSIHRHNTAPRDGLACGGPWMTPQHRLDVYMMWEEPSPPPLAIVAPP
jgi:hypothetical protein